MIGMLNTGRMTSVRIVCFALVEVDKSFVKLLDPELGLVRRLNFYRRYPLILGAILEVHPLIMSK